MPRLRVRVLEELPPADPLAWLRVLPRGVEPVLLDDADAGVALLAWEPDRRVSGRLRPRREDGAGSGAEAPAGASSATADAPPPLADRDPAAELEAACADERWEGADELPLAGGWIGWFGFGCGHAYERFPWLPPDPAGLPDWSFGRYRQALLFDGGRVRLIHAAQLDGASRAAGEEPDQEAARLRRRVRAWAAGLAAPNGSEGGCRHDADCGDDAGRPPTLRAVDEQSRFEAAVAAARRAIGAGEYFQVNLSHRLEAPCAADPRALYARVRAAQPTRMSAYWEDRGGRALLSWSPERFLALRDGVVETRPIKGTAPRGADFATDARRAAELDGSEKERAELTMIVDMARNDLGRVAEPGSVDVLSAGEIESYPTLLHRTATVRARLRDGIGPAELFAATFPPASVTGAPKVRALRAIAEAEDRDRGPYCGAFGHWLPGARPRGDFSVLIRTATCVDGVLRLRVGAGIVWDSDPRREWLETWLKARYLQTDPVATTPPAASP